MKGFFTLTFCDGFVPPTYGDILDTCAAVKASERSLTLEPSRERAYTLVAARADRPDPLTWKACPLSSPGPSLCRGGGTGAAMYGGKTAWFANMRGPSKENVEDPKDSCPFKKLLEEASRDVLEMTKKLSPYKDDPNLVGDIHPEGQPLQHGRWEFVLESLQSLQGFWPPVPPGALAPNPAPDPTKQVLLQDRVDELNRLLLPVAGAGSSTSAPCSSGKANYAQRREQSLHFRVTYPKDCPEDVLHAVLRAFYVTMVVPREDAANDPDYPDNPWDSRHAQASRCKRPAGIQDPLRCCKGSEMKKRRKVRGSSVQYRAEAPELHLLPKVPSSSPETSGSRGPYAEAKHVELQWEFAHPPTPPTIPATQSPGELDQGHHPPFLALDN